MPRNFGPLEKISKKRGTTHIIFVPHIQIAKDRSYYLCSTYYNSKDHSHYLWSTGRAQLFYRKSHFSSLTKERFGRWVDKIKEKVEKPGQSAGMYLPESTETFMYIRDSEKAVGKKFAATNAFRRSPGRLIKGVVPVYDSYKSTFNACDWYNRIFHDRRWPHKNGGRNIPED